MELLAEIEQFEAAESVAATGTGTRREGAQFEALIARLWAAVEEHAIVAGATTSAMTGPNGRRYVRLSVGNRSLSVPAPSVGARAAEHGLWLEVVFRVSELVAAYPSEAEAVRRYAPPDGLFAGERYPEMYDGLTTRFDDTIVLEEDGVLREKVLLEYKTAKSSRGRQIDGNAHERLSFQVMQYLEIATRYTRCSMVVIANGAFARYRNKYHVSFHQQADRLANFRWFRMEHASSVGEYTRFIEGLLAWLFEGADRWEHPR